MARRVGRAISGLSMGGYGALALGLRHPELFGSIGSHGGAVAYARRAAERLRSGEDPVAKKGARRLSEEPNAAIGITGFSSQVERTPKGRLFATAEQAEAHDPFRLVVGVPQKVRPHIDIDSGTEDGLLPANRDSPGC